MSLTPTDTWNARLLELASELADERDSCRRTGWALCAADVDGWLGRIEITWDELVDWMIRKAIEDLEMAACATPDGRHLLERIHRILRTVPQLSELMNVLDLAVEFIDELHDPASSYGSLVMARLRGGLQDAADRGADPAALEDLLRLWADNRGASLSFKMSGNMATIEIEI